MLAEIEVACAPPDRSADSITARERM
eukprot:COSAG01_NODE_34296_length_550_cov_0.569845_2_plen_25_part_01